MKANLEKDDSDAAPERTIRCCFLGDGAVGKTRMILTSVKNSVGGEEQMFFTYATTMEVDGSIARVELCDTQDGAEWQEQRQRVCAMSDLIFLCYSVVSPTSLESVISKWGPSIKTLNKPVILLGNKTDMRNNEELVARLQAKNLKPMAKVFVCLYYFVFILIRSLVLVLVLILVFFFFDCHFIG